MNVRDLIEELKNHDPTLEVMQFNNDRCVYYPVMDCSPIKVEAKHDLWTGGVDYWPVYDNAAVLPENKVLCVLALE